MMDRTHTHYAEGCDGKISLYCMGSRKHGFGGKAFSMMMMVTTCYAIQIVMCLHCYPQQSNGSNNRWSLIEYSLYYHGVYH